MREYLSTVAVFTVVLATSVAACHSTAASNLSGTWLFHIETNDGESENPAFVFKQRADKLSGSYDGHLGQQEVTGSVTGSTAVFGFHTPGPVRFYQSAFWALETITATYTGRLETETKMSGSVEYSNGIKGKWTARRQ